MRADSKEPRQQLPVSVEPAGTGARLPQLMLLRAMDVLAFVEFQRNVEAEGGGSFEEVES